MITELSIRNFAIIDDISISFNDGLTVLTGETGAGKSIIIDAVHLLAGGRASTQYIKHGREKAEIIGQFILTTNKNKIIESCRQYDIDVDEDTIILERTLSKNGKSVCRINNKIVTLAVLKEIGEMFVQIHSQHDTMHLINQQNHLSLLDNYNSKEINPLIHRYQKAYNHLLQLQRKYNELHTDEQEMAHRLDLLQFQLSELEQANLVDNEDEQLELERKQLQNFELIYHALQEAYYALQGEGNGLEAIHLAKQSLEKARSHDNFINKQAEVIANVYYQLEDVSLQINDYKHELYFDENQLNEIESRLNELHRLKKKYGATVKDMIQYMNKVKIEIEEINNREYHVEQLVKDLERAEKEAFKIAKQLSTVRKHTAKRLEEDLKTELNDLYLEHAQFAVHFTNSEQQKLTIDGIDHVTFMLSTNLGEPLKELNKIASGGELSRIMLALKKIFAEHDLIQTVIFDEIDAGVSGRVAQSIAEKMYQIATNTQTLCITHLPQVAAMADHHLLIEKVVKNERTFTNITELKYDSIINELGKMMTGTKLTESALEHAEELIDLTNTFKKLVNGKFTS